MYAFRGVQIKLTFSISKIAWQRKMLSARREFCQWVLFQINFNFKIFKNVFFCCFSLIIIISEAIREKIAFSQGQMYKFFSLARSFFPRCVLSSQACDTHKYIKRTQNLKVNLI